jgi:hypothetical protein
MYFFLYSIFLNFSLHHIPLQQTLQCSDGSAYEYAKLCICTGSSPKLIAVDNEYVLGIRDTETVCHFQRRLADARQIVIVGNGGIATELVHEIQDCKVIWAVKDSCISHVYFDAHAAQFFADRVNRAKELNTADGEFAKREHFTIASILLFRMSWKKIMLRIS